MDHFLGHTRQQMDLESNVLVPYLILNCGLCPATAMTPGPLYTDDHYIKMMGGNAARHETVNNCLKMFECLRQRFRHGVAAHVACFRAVAIIVQLQIEYGESLFDVEYSGK
jgi:hypothetical protein